MKKIFSVLVAVMVVLSAMTVFASAAGENLLDSTKWSCHNDQGDVIVGAAGISVADGKVSFTELQNNWLHLDQTVAVKPNTRYEITIVANLSKGLFRLDVNAGLVTADDQGTEYVARDFNENNFKENNCEGDLNKNVTYKFVFETGDDQDELIIDFRNGSGKGATEATGWFNRAVGTLSGITLVEVTAGSQSGTENAGTADVISVVAVVATVAAAGIVFASKKAH